MDREKIGTRIHGIEVLHLAKMPDLARRMHVHIGVITAPADAAQNIADLMIEGGIQAIWNFAPAVLQVPESVVLQRADIYSSLAVLSKKLIEKM